MAFLRQVIQDFHLYGRLGIYGTYDAGAAFVVLNWLQDATAGTVPPVELVGEFGDTLFTKARETKDDWEIAQLKEAGRLTCLVVGEVQEFIQSHRVRDKTVVGGNGEPLTIGTVKTFMRSRLYGTRVTRRSRHHL